MGAWVDRARRSAAGLLARWQPSGPRSVVLVAGESGAGKSTLAAALAEALEGSGRRVRVVSMDDFYRLPPLANDAARRAAPDRVGPGEVDLGALQRVADSYQEGAPRAVKPRWDGEASAEEPVSLAVDVLVIEGTWALHLDVPGALRVRLTATWEQTRDGRLARARDPIDRFVDEVLAREQPHVQAQAADVRVDLDGTVRWEDA